MALLAGKGWIDLGMADKAIRHSGVCGGIHVIAFVQAAVAGGAGSGSRREPGNELVARGSQIGFGANRRQDDGRGVTKLDVPGVAKAGYRGCPGGIDGAWLAVTGLASLLDGQIVVGRRLAGGRRRVTLQAVESKLQVDAVGERRRERQQDQPL